MAFFGAQKPLFPKIVDVVCLAGLSAMIAGATAWLPFVERLNREPEYTATRLSPASIDINTDLLKAHESEGKIITATVAKKISSSLKGSVKNRRQNQLYFAEVSTLNAESTSAIERAAKQHAALNINYRDLAKNILAQVQKNPVANLSNVDKYDSNGQIGYCFGRALLVHHLLLESGVPQSDIAKIFVFGDLRVQEQMWQFHVAVMIRDAVDGYLVVDPLINELISYKAWIDMTKKFEIKGTYSRARYYVTDPRKFLPSFGKYDQAQLEDPVLKKYFDALAASLARK